MSQNGEIYRNDDKRSVLMYNGVRMPLLGLGTTHSGGYSHDAVVYALRDCGYRSIDTAKRYGVEEQIGKAIKVSSLVYVLSGKGWVLVRMKQREKQVFPFCHLPLPSVWDMAKVLDLSCCFALPIPSGVWDEWGRGGRLHLL